MQLLLVCENQHIFPSGFSLGGNIQGLSLQGNLSQCPFCGLMTPWPEGKFNFINGIFKEIIESDSPHLVIDEVKDDLKSIKEGKTKKLKRLYKWLPDSPEKILVYISIVAALITAWQAVAKNSAPANIENIEINVTNEYNQKLIKGEKE